MVTATRRSQIAKDGDVTAPVVNGSDIVNGKRKVRVPNPNSRSNKRRKTDSQESIEGSEDVEIPETQETMGSLENGINGSTEDTHDIQSAAVTPKNHIRFGSEEPAPVAQAVEQIPKTQFEEQVDPESDDDAPEAIDNSAQLLALKSQAQKQEDARRRSVRPTFKIDSTLTLPRDERLKKEKRRQLDEKNKSQAKATGKAQLERPTSTNPMEVKLQDDDISESTATLQGSISRDTGRLVLPALLPDEILNAEPADRLPSPEAQRQDSKRHKFFKDVEKPPKDLHRGGVTIRVLDNKAGGNYLQPKVSKTGRRVREAWMAGRRNKTNPGGLKRVAGGQTSFVRSR
jgi:U3 small nucleolar RNA-associated protein 16